MAKAKKAAKKSNRCPECGGPGRGRTAHLLTCSRYKTKTATATKGRGKGKRFFRTGVDVAAMSTVELLNLHAQIMGALGKRKAELQDLATTIGQVVHT